MQHLSLRNSDKFTLNQDAQENVVQIVTWNGVKCRQKLIIGMTTKVTEYEHWVPHNTRLCIGCWWKFFDYQMKYTLEEHSKAQKALAYISTIKEGPY